MFQYTYRIDEQFGPDPTAYPSQAANPSGQGTQSRRKARDISVGLLDRDPLAVKVATKGSAHQVDAPQPLRALTSAPRRGLRRRGDQLIATLPRLIEQGIDVIVAVRQEIAGTGQLRQQLLT